MKVLAVAMALLVISDCRRSVRLPPPYAGGRPPGVAACRSADGLPDPRCTPGAIDLRVTQSNILNTICVHGYTSTVRPLTRYTNALKLKQMGEYGYADQNPRDYEEDHLIPLELGGSPQDPLNLWPEPGHSPNPKDAVERRLHRMVCAGRITLAEAQNRIRTNWKTAVN